MDDATVAPHQLELGIEDMAWLSDQLQKFKASYAHCLTPGEDYALCIEYRHRIPIRYYDTLVGWFVAEHDDDVSLIFATDNEREEDSLELEARFEAERTRES